MRTLLVCTAVAMIAAGPAAMAGDDESCTKVPKEQWLSVEQIKIKLGEQGYTVKDIEIEDGCAEADVKDKDGKTFEIKADPATAAIVEKDG
jgi:hypothetical protein